MRAVDFVHSLSRIELKLESLTSTASKLQALGTWLAETHSLKNMLLLDFEGKVFYTAPSSDGTGLDAKELFSYAHNLSGDPAVINPEPDEALVLKPILDGLHSFVHFPLSGDNARLLGSLFLFIKKPADYLETHRSELILVATRMRDLLLLGRFGITAAQTRGETEMEAAQPGWSKNPVTAEQFISMMNYPMFLLNPQGEPVAVNNALLLKLRFANFADFSGHCEIFQDLKSRGEILKVLEREGGVRGRRVSLNTKSGEALAMNLSLAKFGSLVVGSLFDISEYVRVTDDLRESLKMQEFLNDKLISAALLLHKTQSSAIRSLARLAEFRDHETGDHLQRIREYSRLIAREVYTHQPFDFKIRSEYCDDIFLSSMLHDIGKVGIPDHILLKNGKLDSEEWKVMKNHTVIGWTILNQADCELGEQSFLTLASQIALNHHERWDGTGYPYGLLAEKIPLSARISAVADVYDALTSQRPYKKPWHHDDAIKEIRAQSGLAFDPVIVDLLMAVEKKILDVHYRFPK